nr:replication protein A 70 kDa DNA-binding subunit B [Tanacetum cinerariifolium]
MKGHVTELGNTIIRVGSFDNNPHGFKFEYFTAFTARTFTETELCGKPSVSPAMYSTRHLNDDIQEIAAFRQRFKGIVRVIDETGLASLLLFDDLVFKFTNGEECRTHIHKHGPNNDDYFPPELNMLVGKRVLLRFQYTYDHILNNNYLNQIKLLYVDEAMVTRF